MVSQIGYEGAGTVEFIYEDEKFYFLRNEYKSASGTSCYWSCYWNRYNVKEQIHIAFTGEHSSYPQNEIKPRGHAIECRINAEDPNKNFQPSPGKIGMCHVPSGFRTRVDGAIFQGYEITPYYDSLICKLICHGRNRTWSHPKNVRDH